MSESVDIILPLLHEMRAENASLHAKTHEHLAKIAERIEIIEKKVFERGLSL